MARHAYFRGQGARSDGEAPDKRLHFPKIRYSSFAMPEPMDFRTRGPGLKGWVIILVGVAVVVAIGVAIAVVAVGVFLFLLPLLLVMAVIYYLFGRNRFRSRYGRTKAPVVIDGEFRILDASEIDRKPPRQN